LHSDEVWPAAHRKISREKLRPVDRVPIGSPLSILWRELAGSVAVEFRKKSGATIMLKTMQKKFASFLRGNRLRLPARSRNDAGYTLLELLVVMGILAVLTAMATPQLMGYFGKAKTQSVQLQIESIGTALELYYMENGSYPSMSVGLKALVEATPEAPRWNGPYLKKAKNLLDPWGRSYQYVYPVSNGDYEVYSLGPNGKGTSASAQERFARGAGRAG
jgi:general secretion pathway protein G